MQADRIITRRAANRKVNMNTKLRLFIWTDFCPNYTGGLAFAIAKDEADAREQIQKERGYNVYEWGELEIKPLSRRIARCVSGGG